MEDYRNSGVLLHVTSLPGPDGIGDLGPEAYRWISFLAKSGCDLWQVLPLGPTGYGDSPYQCFSAFAGNPYLISSTGLLDMGLLREEDFLDRPLFSSERVDYGPVIQWKLGLLERAYTSFTRSRKKSLKREFEMFKTAQSGWLDDFACFMAIKNSLNGMPWNQWPMEFRIKKSRSVQQFISDNIPAIDRIKFFQFIFFLQWLRLKKYANSRNISIIGDIPIFISMDSSDSWSHPELFQLDKSGRPTAVAGVPPDYFSPTGQLWGNPLYKWSAHKASQYQWWISRVKHALQLYDLIRLDHFRGFASYWSVPAKEKTAEKGAWLPGPGKSLFAAIQAALGKLPILAEDLGEITQDVIKLRDAFHLPGMKILQFAFADDADNPFLPHNFNRDCVAYTGTHDNNTSLGWYMNAAESEQDFCRRYLARSGNDISWDMIRCVWSSTARIALAPMQDLLNLSEDCRMNFPSRAEGNWQWRMDPDVLSDSLIERMREQNLVYGRGQFSVHPGD